MSSDFGVLLRQLRLAGGLSQEALAEAAQISVSAIGAYERGIHSAPHRDTVTMLAQALRLGDAERERFERLARRKPRSAHAKTSGTPVRDTLPLETTTFIGRVSEAEAVEELLRRHRCVTITGIGGIGKTRLALHVARRAAKSFADGVALIELGAISDGTLVAAKAASALGLQIVDARSDLAQVTAQLRGKHVLVVLDNCEHLIESAGDLVSALMQAEKNVTVLATSRERLRISSEAVYRLAPLAPETASALFADRAATADSDFAITGERAGIVADICRKLDGIPLALELAASRAGTLGVHALQAQLTEHLAVLSSGNRDVPTRQRTLDATLAWSFDLLEPREAALFPRLAAFAGGWTLDAAQTVCAGDTLSRDDILDALPSLVDKSLVVLGRDAVPVRYHLLRIARLYASHKAQSTGEAAATAERHAAWMASSAKQAHRDIAMPRRAWHERYDPEIDNMRAAIEWALGDGQAPALAAEIITGFIQVWSDNGLIAEHRLWTKRALERIDAAEHPREAGLLLRMLMKTGIGAESIAAGEQAIALFATLDDPVALAHTFGAQASLYQKSGDAARSEAAADRAAGLYAANGLATSLPFAYVVSIRASLAAQRGDFAAARQFIGAAIAVATECRDDAFISYSRTLLAGFEFLSGDVERALHIVDEALLTAQTMGFRHDEMLLLCNRACYRIGGAEPAAALADAVEALERVRVNDPFLTAVAITHIAAVAAVLQRPEPAATLLGFVEEFLRRTGVSFGLADQRSYRAAYAALREQLAGPILRDRMSSGALLDASAAVDEALAAADAMRIG